MGWSCGGDLERAFGSIRVALLYVISGIFGTVASIVFLPGSLSVGASASVFGLVGANWADVIVNFCARYTLRGSGIICLTIATAFNVLVGFTPWVDNFMHMGGLVAGLMIGVSVFAQKATRDVETGRRVHTCGQETIVLVAVFVLVALMGAAVGVMLSSDLKDFFRTCPFCDAINCIPMPWWSCCSLSLQGSCVGLTPPANASTPLHVTCNMTGAVPFSASCDPRADADCAFPTDHNDGAALAALCAHICSGCNA